MVRQSLQQRGLNYNELYPLNPAAVESLKIEEMGVDVVFLNSDINTKVNIARSLGFEDGTGRVCGL